MKSLIPVFLLLPLWASAALVTFETGQGYTVNTNLGVVNGTTSNAPFSGTNGWSLSTSTGPGRVVATTTSGEYLGGLALSGSATTNQTYIGGLKGIIEVTGVNSISFDAQYSTGIGVGFMGDGDADSLFDQGSGGSGGDTGLAVGVGGSPARFEARYASFGTEIFNPAALAGTSGNWYHFNLLIGESVAGNRALTLAVRNLTAAAEIDLNGAAVGTAWSFTVTDAQFGVAPENALGGFVRLTQAGTNGAKIDNLHFTAVPEPSVGLFGLTGLLALARRRR